MLIVNLGVYYSELGIVYLRFFFGIDCFFGFIFIELELEDGFLLLVNCVGIICEGEIGVYIIFVVFDC